MMNILDKHHDIRSITLVFYPLFKSFLLQKRINYFLSMKFKTMNYTKQKNHHTTHPRWNRCSWKYFNFSFRIWWKINLQGSIFGINVKIKWIQFFRKIKIPPRHFSMVFIYHWRILPWICKVISPKRARLPLFESYSLFKYYLILLHFKINFLY